MAAPPPQSNDDGAAPMEFGIAAVDAHLDDVDLSFPARVEDVKTAFADVEVPYEPGGRPVGVPEIVERTDRTEFESRQDLLNALHPVFEERRTASGTGFLDWFRSLFR